MKLVYGQIQKLKLSIVEPQECWEGWNQLMEHVDTYSKEWICNFLKQKAERIWIFLSKEVIIKLGENNFKQNNWQKINL